MITIGEIEREKVMWPIAQAISVIPIQHDWTAIDLRFFDFVRGKWKAKHILPEFGRLQKKLEKSYHRS